MMGNDDLDATVLGSTGELFDGIGGAMGGEGVDFKRHLHLVEQLAGFFHNGQITCATHDNTY